MSVTILQGDVREVLATLPGDYFDCVVTSPPYWGLRDYGVVGQIGLEPTLAEHLTIMVEVFNQVRRVLKPSGTLWLNYGDCYATTPNGKSAAAYKAEGADDRTFRDKPFSTIGGVLKPKDLCMIPNRLAIALQEAGWWVRSEIIWHKPNPMPESVRDRPTSAHEKVWLLAKSERYFYDADAIREPLAASSIARLGQPNLENQAGSLRANGGAKTNGAMKAVRFGGDKGQGEHGAAARPASGNEWEGGQGANARNVWSIPTQPFKEAHFATMAPELAERCIKAGSPAGGLVLDPFGGAGTTGLVADRLGRHATLIELNLSYIDIARRRIEGDAPLFTEVETTVPAA